MVSPRNSRSKSLCCSRRVTGTPRRARRRARMAPPGPPPTMQQEVLVSVRISSAADSGSTVAERLMGHRHRARFAESLSQNGDESLDGAQHSLAYARDEGASLKGRTHRKGKAETARL